MEALTTNGITIGVESFYQKKHSNPRENRFIHSYQVTISNEKDSTVQLVARHWYIVNGAGKVREVSGEGVIGKQPTLAPGDSHRYVSWAPITTNIGKMYGYYTFRDTKSNEMFLVNIPEFKLVSPGVLN